MNVQSKRKGDVAARPSRFKKRLAAVIELERVHLRAPVKGAARLQIFGRVVHCTIIRRIDGHGAVVTPARQATGLAATTIRRISAGMPLHSAGQVRRRTAYIRYARK